MYERSKGVLRAYGLPEDDNIHDASGLPYDFYDTVRGKSLDFGACSALVLPVEKSATGKGVFVGRNHDNLLGTIVAVVIANLWARRTGRPTSIVLLPAIVLLVSGSIGFRGLASIAAGDVVIGEQQFLQMFVVALTILAGILVGNTIVRSEPTL